MRKRIGLIAGVVGLAGLLLFWAGYGWSLRRRRRKETEPFGLRGNPPRRAGNYQSRFSQVISMRTDLHTVCIFYRHVL